MFDLFTNTAYLTSHVLEPVLILLASLLIGSKLNSFLNDYLSRHGELSPRAPFSILLQSIRGLPRVWCLAIGIYGAICVISLSESVKSLLSSLLFAIVIFSVTRVMARVVRQLIAIYAAGTMEDASGSSLLVNLSDLAIYACGIIFILSDNGISIAPIITALGVGGMALALGLQEMLANIFAGLHLLLSKQIQVGNHIRLSSGEEGMVTDITWRYTTIWTLAKNNVIVPNKTMAAATITNYDLPREELAITIPVGVSYDSDLDKVESVTLDVANQVTGWTESSSFARPLVRFTDFADSSIAFSVILYLPHYMDQGMVRHEFIKALTQRYREESIEIPYPVRTIIGTTS